MRLSLTDFNREEAKEIISCAVVTFLKGERTNEAFYIFVEGLDRDE